MDDFSGRRDVKRYAVVDAPDREDWTKWGVRIPTGMRQQLSHCDFLRGRLHDDLIFIIFADNDFR